MPGDVHRDHVWDECWCGKGPTGLIPTFGPWAESYIIWAQVDHDTGDVSVLAAPENQEVKSATAIGRVQWTNRGGSHGEFLFHRVKNDVININIGIGAIRITIDEAGS